MSNLSGEDKINYVRMEQLFQRKFEEARVEQDKLAQAIVDYVFTEGE